ncbi:MAG: hypothetical protein L7T62_02800 [Flavobacteriaceae bacterium]|jgi:hypothetical protein|nr:hypothetical protein [Flavobacteriaceae bacterium]
MKKLFTLLSLSILLFLSSCAGDGAKTNSKKLADGVFQKNGFIYDMKELPSGKNVIPFYTIGKLSSNVLSNSFTNPPTEMGISLYFSLNKKGENKNEIISAYLESTSTDQTLFKFPRCLSVCPITIEVFKADGTTETLKTMYARPNVFKMELEDLVLADLAEQQQKIRMRIAISRNNQNTTFEWFDFDLSGFSKEL